VLSLAKHTAKLTVKTALQGDQLSKLSRENEDEAIEIISEVVRSLNDAINVGNKLSLEQIYDTALCIMTECWFFKIDEILNCFKMVKAGKLGEVKRLDQPTIMGFLHKYDTEVKAEFYENSAVVHQRRSPEENSEPKHVALGTEEMQKLAIKKTDKK